MIEKQTIREKVDPEGELPDVELVPYSGLMNNGGIVYQRVTIKQNGEAVGNVVIKRDSNSHETWVGMVGIMGSKVRRGLGTAAYLKVIEKAQERGDAFRTDRASKSESAKGVWQHFIDAGVAQVVEPFEPLVDQPEHAHQTLYAGCVEIPAPILIDSAMSTDTVDLLGNPLPAHLPARSREWQQSSSAT